MRRFARREWRRIRGDRRDDDLVLPGGLGVEERSVCGAEELGEAVHPRMSLRDAGTDRHANAGHGVNALLHPPAATLQRWQNVLSFLVWEYQQELLRSNPHWNIRITDAAAQC